MAGIETPHLSGAQQNCFHFWTLASPLPEGAKLKMIGTISVPWTRRRPSCQGYAGYFLIKRFSDSFVANPTSSVQARVTRPAPNRPFASLLRERYIATRNHFGPITLSISPGGRALHRRKKFHSLIWNKPCFILVREMYGIQTEIRLRPSYFPFTEPSAEMDVYWD